MTFTQQLAYRAKAILAGVGVAVVGLAEWVVQDPATAAKIEHLVPAPWDQLVPVVLGAIATGLVHQVPNAAPTATGADNDDLAAPTTAISTIQSQDGVETGAGR